MAQLSPPITLFLICDTSWQLLLVRAILITLFFFMLQCILFRFYWKMHLHCKKSCRIFRTLWYKIHIMILKSKKPSQDHVISWDKFEKISETICWKTSPFGFTWQIISQELPYSHKNYLMLKACVHYFFILSPNNSLLKTMKNAFYFI